MLALNKSFAENPPFTWNAHFSNNCMLFTDPINKGFPIHPPCLQATNKCQHAAISGIAWNILQIIDNE